MNNQPRIDWCPPTNKHTHRWMWFAQVSNHPICELCGFEDKDREYYDGQKETI